MKTNRGEGQGLLVRVGKGRDLIDRELEHHCLIIKTKQSKHTHKNTSFAAYRNRYLKSDQCKIHPRSHCFWHFQWRPEPNRLVS